MGFLKREVGSADEEKPYVLVIRERGLLLVGPFDKQLDAVDWALSNRNHMLDHITWCTFSLTEKQVNTKIKVINPKRERL